MISSQDVLDGEVKTSTVLKTIKTVNPSSTDGAASRMPSGAAGSGYTSLRKATSMQNESWPLPRQKRRASAHAPDLYEVSWVGPNMGSQVSLIA